MVSHALKSKWCIQFTEILNCANSNVNESLIVLGSICSNGLLEDTHLFPESIFTASASRPPDFGASSGRLYSSQPWCLPENHTNENQFLQIRLPGIFSLSAVATVGGDLGYVTSYVLSYMVTGHAWRYALVDEDKVCIFHEIFISIVIEED